MDNNIINVTNEDGTTFPVEVLDIFNVAGYEGKDYILYTRGEAIDDLNEKVYVSILNNDSNNNYVFATIEDSNEWNAVEQAIQNNLVGEANG